jgi:hypothetical protein
MDAIDVVKIDLATTSPTSTPVQNHAVPQIGLYPRSASPSREGARVPVPTLPASRPLNPPSTPQGVLRLSFLEFDALSNKRHENSREEKRNKAKAHDQVPQIYPSKSMIVDVPFPCDHLRHPACSSSFEEPLCPRCKLKFAVDQLRVIQRAIENRGGAHYFRATVESKYVKPLLHGGDKKYMNYSFVKRMDLSHRHSKKRLLAIKSWLETKVEEEAAWEQSEFRKYPWLSLSQVEGLYFSEFVKHSARASLHLYSRLEAAGCLTLVEDHHSFAVHNSAADLPIDNEEVQKSRVRKLNSEVRMADAYNPYLPRFDGAKESSPKRKRRDPRPSVSFDPEVKVCVSRDIDVLRKDAATLPIATDEPLRSILRAAADQDVANTARAHSSLRVTTKRLSETIALKSEDSKETARPQWLSSRNCSAYRPGA